MPSMRYDILGNMTSAEETFHLVMKKTERQMVVTLSTKDIP